MYLTVTANAALDRLLFINRFCPSENMRTIKSLDAVGGKGYDVSVALRCLGQETIAIGFLAGQTGKILDSLLETYGIQRDLVWIEGETRVAYILVETDLQRHSHVMDGGYSVTERDYKDLFERYSKHLIRADWVIASGSLPMGIPDDFYRVITESAKKCGVPVLIDTQGQPARLSLSARPDIIKMNRSEFAKTFSPASTSFYEMGKEARNIIKEYELTCMVITCGLDGILAITPEGVFRIQGPAMRVVNAAGAGDVASACLAWRLCCGDGWVEALRWAAAAGTASVTTEATAECDWKITQDLYPLISQVRLD